MSGNYPRHPVLLVDDEDSWLVSFRTTLRSKGIDNIVLQNDSTKVLQTLATRQFCAVAIDLMMPNCSGEELIPQIVEAHPHIPVLVISGLDQVKSAVSCMRMGAFDFIVKTEERDTLISAVRHAIELFELRQENTSLRERFFRKELDHPEHFADIVTQNNGMRSIFQYIEAIAETTRPVLVTGESGVGKELVARSIHAASGRSGDFVALNIAGLDDNVVADTLFGHIKGAFTGAASARMGLVEKAHNGTLFLDEIGDLSPVSQTKLLRLLQEHEYMPLGSDMSKRSTARIVAATHQNLQEKQESGAFRQDLFYRLRGHLLQIPPLRERKDDLPELIEFFFAEACTSFGQSLTCDIQGIARLLYAYSFPGNIRELQHLIFDSVGICQDAKLTASHVSRLLTGFGDSPLQEADTAMTNAHIDFSSGPSATEQNANGETTIAFGQILPTLSEAREALIEEALSRSGNNQSGAAQLIGVTRQAISKYVRGK